MFVSHHTLKWTRTCRSHGRHPHAHTAHFLLNRHNRLPAVRPLVRERRDRAPAHGIAGGADHRGGDPGARHGLHGREGPPARGRGTEKGGSRSVGVSRGGRNAKVHVASNGESTVVEIHVSPGDEHDAAHGRRSMAALGASVGAHPLMGRAYERDSTRLPAESFGLTPVVIPRGTVRPHGITTGRRTRGGTWSNASSTA